MYYVIIKSGIYQHGVHGIFSSKAVAMAKCELCAAKDIDDYHEWQVLEVPRLVVSKPEQIQGEGFDKIVYRTRKGDL